MDDYYKVAAGIMKVIILGIILMPIHHFGPELSHLMMIGKLMTLTASMNSIDFS